ncbi:Membrane-associated tyrosine- and threonine-specific cdc2-inhibitory kinase, partial [Aphelenchoides avenae]
EGRKTPKRRCPPAPRAIRTAPTVSRFAPESRASVFNNGPKIVSCKPPEKAPRLSPVYNPARRVPYLEQCFVTEATIGCGSFGEVYRVRSREDGLRYAVKCQLEPYRGMSDREMKIGEVKKIEGIPAHPNFVRFVRAWEENHRLYIQMELCETSLDALAKLRGALDEATVWNIFLDMVKALDHLHAHNLLHLDVKPENIFMTHNGVFKLGDFGLVVDLSKDDASKAYDGDSRYLAPEVLNDKPSKAADIFSLGITIFELATDAALPAHGERWHDLREGRIPQDFVDRKLERK